MRRRMNGFRDRTAWWFCTVLWLAAAVAAESGTGARSRGNDTAGTAPRQGTVTAGVLNIRARPGLRYEVVGQLHKGDVVKVVVERGDWLGIVPPRGTRAWVAAQYIDADGRIAGDAVRVRSGPGLVFTPLGTVARGTRVERIGEPVNGWQRVVPPEGVLVWVAKEFVAVEPLPLPPAARPGKTGGKQVQAGGSGKPGGKSPAAGAERIEQKKPAAGQRSEAETPPGEKKGAPEEPAAGASRGETSRETAGAGGASAARVVAEKTAAGAARPQPRGEAQEKPEQNKAEKTPGGAARAEGTPPEEPDLGRAAPAAAAPAPVSAVAEKKSGTEGEEVVQRTVREGIIVPLSAAQRSRYATHVLCEKTDGTLRPVCYLLSAAPDIDLADWEYRVVRVYGREVRYRGWSRPTVIVDGVQLVLP